MYSSENTTEGLAEDLQTHQTGRPRRRLSIKVNNSQGN